MMADDIQKGSSMKVLAIGGSPRGLKSQTNRLTEALLAAAKEKGAETDFIDLGQAKLKFCGACEACHRGPKCVLDDDGNGIMDRMLEADGIVLATPVYLDQVTAQMKTLLDRTSHFVHCLRLTGKYLAVVTTSGGGGGEATAAFLKRYAVTVGAQIAGSVDARVPLGAANLAAARELGTSLVTAIAEKKTWPDQGKAIDEQLQRFGQIIAFQKDHWPFEYKYWQDKGWL